MARPTSKTVSRRNHIPNKSIARTSLPSEPVSPCLPLTTLLSEPETRMLMRADHVDEQKLVAALEAVASKLRARRSGGKHHELYHRSDDSNYRPGVGILLINARGEVLVAQRVDSKGNTWQMPQGGIEPGETPRAAALRQLREEIRTDAVEILAETEGCRCYEVPHRLAQRTWQGHWRGQRQKWFVMLFKGHDSNIDLAASTREFDAWQWVPIQQLPRLAVSFKRQLYRDLPGEFEPMFAQPSVASGPNAAAMP